MPGISGCVRNFDGSTWRACDAESSVAAVSVVRAPAANRFMLCPLFLLIDADVIHEIARGEPRIVDALLAAPRSADRQIDQKVLRGVERPDRRARPFVPEGEELLPVDRD